MKKILITLLLLFSITTFAETYFKAYSVAIASIDNTGHYHWSDWTKCDVDGYVSGKKLVIYSKEPQIYTIIYDCGKTSRDTYSYKIKDQDGDRGTLRIRKEDNGNLQMYIDFANIAWCYNFIVENE